MPGGQLRTNGNNSFSAYMIVVVQSVLTAREQHHQSERGHFLASGE